MTRFSLLVFGLSLLPAAAAAQEPPQVGPGAVVRVWTSPTSAPVIGKVVGLDASSLTLAAEGIDSPVSVNRNAITRLDVSRGRRSRGKTVLYGVLIGVGTAFVLGMIDGDEPSNRFLALTAVEKGLILNIVTVPAGAIVGALVGPGPERWTTTTLQPVRNATRSALPSPSLRLTLRF